MKTSELIKEIQKLPRQKQMYVIERSMQLIKLQEEENILKKAAEKLYPDYAEDKELTIFSEIDMDRL
jgi:hypothetical protein